MQHWLWVLFAASLFAVLFGAATVQWASQAIQEDLERQSQMPDVTSLELSNDAVTTDDGNFSATKFHEATGLLPSEYLIAYVAHQDGRVAQSDIVESQPWSASTVTRLLSKLPRPEGRGIQRGLPF